MSRKTVVTIICDGCNCIRVRSDGGYNIDNWVNMRASFYRIGSTSAGDESSQIERREYDCMLCENCFETYPQMLKLAAEKGLEVKNV